MHSGHSRSGAPLRRTVLGAPALQALLIQLVSFALVVAAAFSLPSMAEMQLSIALAALLQGAIAALLSRLRRMAPWWLPIQFVFPIASLTLHALHFPPWMYMAGFLALLCLYWSTFRTQVPYFPSTRPVWEAVRTLLPQDGSIRFVDIGSGFGGLVMHLARLRPESDFCGVELAPMPWFVSLARAKLMQNGARFVRADYEAMNFADYDVVFAYLSPAAMPGLWSKACAEMRHGALLLSYEFAVPGVEAHIVLQPVENGPPLYGWYFK